MAERNWRDEFEPKDKLDRKVTDVIYHNGSPWGYMIYTVAMGHFPSTDVHRLIPKPKPKTYRPWTRDEVPVGSVVKSKTNGFRGMITGVASCGDMIRISDSSQTVKYVFDNYEMLDGSPCGVEE